MPIFRYFTGNLFAESTVYNICDMKDIRLSSQIVVGFRQVRYRKCSRTSRYNACEIAYVRGTYF
jgi:hypothetical protein